MRLLSHAIDAPSAEPLDADRNSICIDVDINVSVDELLPLEMVAATDRRLATAFATVVSRSLQTLRSDLRNLRPEDTKVGLTRQDEHKSRNRIPFRTGDAVSSSIIATLISDSGNASESRVV